MNDFVTFYYPPERQGETLFLELSAPSGSSKAVVYSHGPLQSSLGLKSHRFGDVGSYRQALSSAAEILRKQGGLLLEWSASRYRAGLFPTAGYTPPSSLLLLSLAGEPRLVALQSGPEAARESTQRLVVPVDQNAEKHLQAWLQQAAGFPDDVQTVLYNSLRRPALEARLSRLENHLNEKPSARAVPADTGEESRPAFLQPWIAAPALVALIFLVVVIGIYSANWGLPGFSPVPFRSASTAPGPSQPEEDSGVEQPTGPAAGSGDAGGPGQGTPVQEESKPPEPPPPPPLLGLPDADFQQPVEQMLSEWSACGEATAAAKLYRTHLAPALAAHPDDHYAALKEEAAVWGLAKLHGLAAGLTFSEAVLTRPDYRSALKINLRRAGIPQALQPTFAYFGCLAFDQPGLKEYPGDDDAAPLLIEGADCGSIDRQSALSALDQLSSFLRTQSAQ